MFCTVRSFHFIGLVCIGLDQIGPTHDPFKLTRLKPKTPPSPSQATGLPTTDPRAASIEAIAQSFHGDPVGRRFLKVPSDLHWLWVLLLEWGEATGL